MIKFHCVVIIINTHGIYFVCNNACVLLIEYVLTGKHCLKPF